MPSFSLVSCLSLLNRFLFGPALPLFLFGAGLFLAFRYRFFHLRRPIKLLRGMMNKSGEEGLSPFSALSLALASTLGVGNIVGVATAIFAGGPGAVFWIWVSALLSMLIKYTEVFLGVKYRQKDPDGTCHGGAFFYIRDGLNMPKTASFFAILFLLNGLTVGNMVQVKAAADAFWDVFAVPPFLTGLILSLLTLLVICGGVKKISAVTVRLIPALSLLFTAVSLYVLVTNLHALPSVLARIVREALTPRAAGGGFSFALFMTAMRYGVGRGILSNEAGSGTSPTAHASAKTKSPVEQGFWGIAEVFIDTVVVCSMTALVILLSYDRLVIGEALDGMELSIAAYAAHLGPMAGVFLAVCVLIFAYATLICQGFYGSECLRFLSSGKRYDLPYKLFFGGIVFLGSVLSPILIWEASDLVVSSMTLLNTLCVLALSREASQETDLYFSSD
ncbi:MAG: sodium:alanine symporter family protein [Ruminococcaceae bacterium]|nr:sodium:alanine symporter family protein [Oscillospiraceae bacterium]